MNSKMIVLFSLFLAGCSLAPMMTTRNAKTLGEGKNKIQASPGLPVLGASYERGVSDNWDLGVAAEVQLGTVYSAMSKYAFINNEEGTSLAMSGGGFYGSGLIDSHGFYAGPIVSWRKNWFEVFFFPRYNYVQTHGIKATSENQTDNLIFDLVGNSTKFNFQYVQLDLGFNFYTNKTFNLGFGASAIKLLNDKNVKSSDWLWLPEFMIGFNF